MYSGASASKAYISLQAAAETSEDILILHVKNLAIIHNEGAEQTVRMFVVIVQENSQIFSR